MRNQHFGTFTAYQVHRHLFGIQAPLYDEAPPLAPPPAPPAPPPGPKVIEIPEDELEQRIVGRIKQAEAQWKKSNVVSTLTAEERVELETARKEREEAKRKDLEAKGHYEAALKAQEESLRKPYEEEKGKLSETIKGLTDRLQEKIVRSNLLAAAAAGNAYNAQQVVDLNERFVKLDDNFEPTVVDDKGQPRFVAGKPMTQEQLIDEFLRANPNHVKAQGGQGGGAAGGASRAGVETSELEKLEAAVVEAEKEYKQTRTTVALTKHRKAVELLNAAKHKSAA